MEQYKFMQDYTYIEQDNLKVKAEMTLPDERYRAVLAAEGLLLDLINPQISPSIPTEIRARARAILRHYPRRWDMDLTAEKVPGIFRRQLEDLERFILQGSLDKQGK